MANSQVLVNMRYNININTWFAPAVIDAAGMNQVKSAYTFTKSIPNGEFVGSTDV